MLPYKRSQRVAHLFKEEIADIIMNRVNDPRIGFVSVTDVEVTEDLKLARVFVSILKEEERETGMEALNQARSFIRSELGGRVRMRFIPALEFRLDTSLDYASKIEGLLKKIREEEGER
ncbi:MAG: 30S ribosome-binding factor RbfA [Thermodesulfovibrionales bacterium]|nr:30S ribosome-binding factor RbfA [Thermodesulfovibrionales bacterium]